MKCSKCKKEKKTEDFPFKNKLLGKISTVCKTCQREYKRLHYHKNKQAHYDRNNIQREKLRQYYFNAKDVCIVCGETEKCCLDFHHIKDKDKDVAKYISYGSISRIQKEINKCVVLCSNCHRKVHAGIVILE